MNQESINDLFGLSLVATLGILALFIILVIFQRRENGGWLGWSAMSLELLGGALAISWAAGQSDGLLKVVFVGGIIGLALAKATIITPLIKSGKEGDSLTIFFGMISIIGAYGLIFAAGSFAGGINSAGKAAQAAAESAPVVAINAQLEVARDKLTSLSGFADTGRASSESSKAAAIQARLNAAQKALSNCPPNYITKCINPAQSKVDNLQQQLSALTYHSGNQSYAGTKQLIADLEEQKAALLASGSVSSLSGFGADDKMLAMIFSISEEKARQIKWMVFVASFDVISLFFRLFGERSKIGISEAKLLGKQFESMMNLGYSQQAAAALIGGSINQLETTLNNDHLTSSIDCTRAPSRAVSSETEEQPLLSNENDLYTKWLGEVKRGDIKCTQADAKRFISSNMTQGGKTKTITPMGMVAVHKRWLDQATADGILKPLGGIGKASHQLA